MGDGKSLTENRFYLSSRLEPIFNFTQSNLGFRQFHFICICAAPPTPPLSQGTRHGSFAFQSFVNRQMKHSVTAFTWRHKKQWLHPQHSFPPILSDFCIFIINCLHRFNTRQQRIQKRECVHFPLLTRFPYFILFAWCWIFVSFSFCGASRPERWEPFFSGRFHSPHPFLRAPCRACFILYFPYLFIPFARRLRFFFFGSPSPRVVVK